MALTSADAAARVAASFPMVPGRARVLDRKVETADTVTLTVEPIDQVLHVVPGQFTMLGVPGAGEAPLSVSGGGTTAGDPVLHTVRDVGGVTHLLASAAVGDLLTVRGPYGTGWAAGAGVGRELVVVAGGIGLAPLRPVLREAVADSARFDRVALLYGARSPVDVLYADEVEQWRAAGVEVEVTVDYATPGWPGRVGLVTALLGRAVHDPARTLALVCGPEVMMRLVAAHLVAAGVAAERVRVSLERNMHCGVGLCGHCQLRELFLCVDGPVLPWSRVGDLLSVREL